MNLVQASSGASTSTASPPVNIKLRGPWPVQPPLLLEALQAVASEEPESFFPFVTHLTGPWALLESEPGTSKAQDAGLNLAQASSGQVYRAAHAQLNKHAYLFDPAARQSYNLSLALHAEAPKVEAFWQVYATNGLEKRWEGHVQGKGVADAREECGSWVDWAGEVICTNDELRDALASATEKQPVDPVPALLPFDHVLPAKKPASAGHSASSAGSATYTAVMYGDPFSANFWALHTTLFEHALGTRGSEGDARKSVPIFRYVLRWRPPTARLAIGNSDDAQASTSASSAREEPYRRQHSYLSSYGGTLDLKKVDYLVIDDRKLKHSADTGSAEADSSSQSPAILSLEERKKEREEHEFMHRLLAGGDSQKADQQKGTLADLTNDEIETLGIRASTLVLQSPNPLLTLRQLSHNFPTFAVALARSYEDRIAPGGTEDGVKSFEASQEIYQRQSYSVQAGSSDIWLNGRGMAESELWPLSLIKVLRKERQIIRSLEKIHPSLNRTQAVDLLQFPAISRAMQERKVSGSPGGPSEEIDNTFFDASDRIERKALAKEGQAIRDVQGPISYWNNIETDDHYRRYPRKLQTLLRPAWPGSLPTIRRNLFNAVIVMDLRRRETIQVLAETVAMMIPRLAVRWGFVPGGLELDPSTSEGKESLQLARLYYLGFTQLNPAQLTTHFLRIAGAETSETTTDFANFRLETIAALKHADRPIPAASTGTERAKSWAAYLDDTLLQGKDELVESLIDAARKYARRLRATKKDSERGHFFVNGQRLPVSSAIMQSMNTLISEQLQTLAREVYRGTLDDSSDVENYFYDREETFTSRPTLVFPEADPDTGVVPSTKVVDLLEATAGFGAHEQVVNSFVYPEGEHTGDASGSPNATLWIVGDLDTRDGANLVRTGLNMVLESRVRLGFVHQPSSRPATSQAEITAPRLSTYLYQLINSGAVKFVTPSELRSTIDDFIQSIPASNVVPVGQIKDDSNEVKQQALGADEATPNWAKEAGWQIADAVQSTSFWQKASIFASRLGVQQDSFAVVLNGRVVKAKPEEVTEDDLRTLIVHESKRRILPVIDGLRHVGIDLDEFGRESYTDTVTLASSVLGKAFSDDGSEGGLEGGPNLRSSAVERLPAADSSIEIGDRSTASYRFVAIINPVSERSQRIIGIIDLLSRMQGVWIKVVFNPDPMLTELPLKRYYRFNAPHDLTFKDDEEVPSSLAFLDMPQDAVLTMGLEAPSAWLTMPEEAVYDLDNIRLKDVPPQERQLGVSATYEIKHVLIEGHAQSDGRTPPRGLQLVLKTPDETEQLDTIVMANLAYFQFKARPGMFHLTIREGRSQDIYRLESVGANGLHGPNVNITGNVVVLDSLDGLTILPKFGKRPGMELEDVLESDIDKYLEKGRRKKTSMFGQAKDAFSSLANKASSLVNAKNSRTNAAINIFTVASGHLYERMTYIMILSVLKHTKSTVKFWFIENFLSPSFKEFIPHLAAEYGFQYELVTYAWPHWLRPQREKQRIIWGYKILFLDVLFPLDLDKVIFVDADQIVRTDMKELVDLDLQGAPYGYPPMGNDSYDMDNFRFWEQGYWKEFLRGKPYHISALYVVDLKNFREMAAGDILRGQYQGLSSDPNSLANLDQDLPNHLQHTVPIHTLDKTWLWCETWCSTDWLPQAKTIDLCSNPKTKEPKLDRARRQIPEWTEYDNEVAAFAQRLAEANRLGKNVVAPGEVEQVSVKERIEEVGKSDKAAAGTDGSTGASQTGSEAESHMQQNVHDEL